MTIEAMRIDKAFGDPPTYVLREISFTIASGEFVALTGRSGSGKSTLLYILSSLDVPSDGTVVIDGRDLVKLSPRELHAFRNRELGFVFQFHYLMPELTAIENVLMPALKAGEMKARREPAARLLDEFGLEGKHDRLPRHLSGGEQQRVAIARSLIMGPRYLFADEPTGSLDTANGETVMRILENVNREAGTTVILVTHDSGFAARARRRIHLADGRVVGDETIADL